MFENENYDVILQRAIDRVKEWAENRRVTLDTREGSIIRTSMSPFSFEVGILYAALMDVLDESFADTASRPFLIRRAAERGLSSDEATFAIRQGEFNIDVPIGSRFSLNRLNYIVTVKISDGIFEMQCETAGNVGNLESGTLIPIDYIDGLTSARLTDVLIPGEDEESTESFRRRYFDSLNAQAFGGNIRDYVEKTLEIPGVGGVKVYRAWNGGGTVKLVILDSQYHKPSDYLVNEVQTLIDPEQNQGEGMGLATIGHIVTVVGVDETIVNISAHITFQTGWDWTSVLPSIEQTIDKYFNELAEEWDDVDWVNDPAAGLVVRISQIETRILNLTGILDIQNTAINGQALNLQLDPDNIPVRGSLTNV